MNDVITKGNAKRVENQEEGEFGTSHTMGRIIHIRLERLESCLIVLHAMLGLHLMAISSQDPI